MKATENPEHARHICQVIRRFSKPREEQRQITKSTLPTIMSGCMPGFEFGKSTAIWVLSEVSTPARHEPLNEVAFAACRTPCDLSTN